MRALGSFRQLFDNSAWSNVTSNSAQHHSCMHEDVLYGTLKCLTPLRQVWMSRILEKKEREETEKERKEKN